MIKLCDSTVIAVCEDGRSGAFDPDDIQAKLLRSFIAAGIQEAWIAEDLSLAVERALQDMGSGKTFTVQEIDSLVVKALREVGFPEVAEHYESTQISGLRTVAVTDDKILDIVSRFIGPDDNDCRTICGKITAACAASGIVEASPSLILELARHFHHERFDASGTSCTARNADKGASVWLVHPEDIRRCLSSETVSYIDKRTISISGISRLFPSAKITIALRSLAKNAAIEPPVTEIALFPHLSKLAVSINETLCEIRRIYNAASGTQEELPAYLRLSDAAAFSKDMLESHWPDTAPCITDIMDSLASMVEYKVNVRNIAKKNR